MITHRIIKAYNYAILVALLVAFMLLDKILFNLLKTLFCCKKKGTVVPKILNKQTFDEAEEYLK